MRHDEVRELIRQYLKRYSSFQNSLKNEYCHDLNYSVMEFRNSQLSTFLADAIPFKDIDLNDKQKCLSADSITTNQQYYLLPEKKLKSYFSFRTFIKRGVYLKNNHNYNFLLMYLIEVVNGIHGESLKEKCNLLSKVFSIILFEENEEQNAKFNSILDEAYNIVFIQNINSITKDDFTKKHMPVLSDTTLDKSHDLNDPKQLFHHALKLVNLDKNDNYTRDEKRFINFSFEYICNKIWDLDFDHFDFLYLPELFDISYEDEIYTTYSRIKALYPVTLNIEFIDLNTMVKEIFKCGIHSSSRLYFTDDQLKKINFLFKLIIDSVKHHLNDVALPIIDNSNIINTSNRLNYIMSKDLIDAQKTIDNIIGKWFENNPLVKYLYNNSLDEDLIEYAIKYPEEANKWFNALETGIPYHEDEYDENGNLMDEYEIMMKNHMAYLEYGRDD